jgi:sulfoxide reductase heme-binding subunit YedZ
VTPVAATLSPTTYWYLTRATGAVALVLLTASVVLGILGSVRFSLAPRWPRFAIDVLHRDVSLLVLVFVALHVVTSVLDGFAPIALIDGLIPFRSPYRPLWLGLGAVSFDLLLALGATSLVRRRLGYRAWRAIHWLAYASWPVAVLHTVGTGTDVKSWWMLLLTAVCVAAVLIAVFARVGRSAGAPRASASRPERCRWRRSRASPCSRSPGRSEPDGPGRPGRRRTCWASTAPRPADRPLPPRAPSTGGSRPPCRGP